MEVTREIRCKGCGETGLAAWEERRWHADVQPVLIPLRVTGRFAICGHGASHAVACGRCQQIYTPD